MYLITQAGITPSLQKLTELEEINKPTNIWGVLIPPTKARKTRSKIKNLEYLKPYIEGK